jgi:hypothetical protein
LPLVLVPTEPAEPMPAPPAAAPPADTPAASASVAGIAISVAARVAERIVFSMVSFLFRYLEKNALRLA